MATRNRIYNFLLCIKYLKNIKNAKYIIVPPKFICLEIIKYIATEIVEDNSEEDNSEKTIQKKIWKRMIQAKNPNKNILPIIL